MRLSKSAVVAVLLVLAIALGAAAWVLMEPRP